MLHARDVVETLAGGAASAPLYCPAVNYGTQHPRRDALETAFQTDPGLHGGVARVIREIAGEVGPRSLGLCMDGTRTTWVYRHHSMVSP